MAGSLFAAPLAVEAQRAAGKVYRLGILSPGAVPGDPSVPTMPNLLPTVLREHGYVEGRNLVVERRFADDKPDRLAGLARELVQIRPDIIVALSGQAAQVARDATTKIPIVMVIAADPVALGVGDKSLAPRRERDRDHHRIRDRALGETLGAAQRSSSAG